MTTTDKDPTPAPWRVFDGTVSVPRPVDKWPEAPPWRQFHGELLEERSFTGADQYKGETFRTTPQMVEMVNAALHLRRPLLLTGRPGSGKSSVIEAVAWALELGRVLVWAVTSRTSLKDGLYQYDALGRLYEQQRTNESPDIGRFIELGPLGTALLPTRRPRALLIDEIDKSDMDFPNDLLNVFERGEFHIPELARLENDKPVYVREFGGAEKFPIGGGQVRCLEFPFVVLTSNGERDFPAPFLRRCLRYSMPSPTDFNLLESIVVAHLGQDAASRAQDMIEQFAKESANKAVATDQLLNAVFLIMRSNDMGDDEKLRVLTAVTRELADSTGPR